MPERNRTRVVCVAEFHAKEGSATELIEVLHGLIQLTHTEPGCLRYELNQRIGDARWITFIEKWTDRKVFDEHCATAYIVNFFDNERPRLVEDYEVKLYEEILP
jgi:quinol monooxygenase YgiN